MDDIRHRIPHAPVRLLDQLRLHMRKTGLAYKTEQTYIHWIKRFMGLDLDNLQFSRARVHRRLPVVYSREEIAAILAQLRGVHRLQVELMYGTGLRSAELLSLRIKDIDFGSNNIFVRAGKGNKDRTTMLPQRLIPALQRQIANVERLHAQDIEDGYLLKHTIRTCWSNWGIRASACLNMSAGNSATTSSADGWNMAFSGCAATNATSNGW